MSYAGTRLSNVFDESTIQGASHMSVTNIVKEKSVDEIGAVVSDKYQDENANWLNNSLDRAF